MIDDYQYIVVTVYTSPRHEYARMWTGEPAIKTPIRRVWNNWSRNTQYFFSSRRVSR